MRLQPCGAAFGAGLRWALPALLLAGCAIERSPLDAYAYTGQNLRAIAFKEIPAADSKISFTGDDPTKRREAQGLSDRDSERITFKNNATLRYDKITINAGFPSAWSDADNIQADVQNGIFYKDRAIVFDRSMIKSGGYYTYLLQSSPTHNCFVFRGTFGDTQKSRAGSPGDQSISGGMCYTAQSKSLDALEREMTDILGRARFDDGAGNRALPPVQTAAAAAPAQAAAAKPLAPADIGVFVLCYSQRLDVLYRARACAPADKTVDDGEQTKESAAGWRRGMARRIPMACRSPPRRRERAHVGTWELRHRRPRSHADDIAAAVIGLRHEIDVTDHAAVACDLVLEDERVAAIALERACAPRRWA